MSDQASDVAKALAAFGSPAIRYHSFGQAAVRPSGVVMARRVNWPTRPPEEQPAAERVQQAEPAAAPGPEPSARPHPTARVPWQGTAQAAPLFPAGDAAAIPRPLAEWAVPAAPAAPMLLGSAMMPLPRLAPAVPQPGAAAPDAATVLPLVPPSPSVVPPLMPRPDIPSVVYPVPALTMAPQTPAPALAPALVAAGRSTAEAGSVGLSPASTLPEIFEFLASATRRSGAPRR